ncbi:copper amine oxidase [Pyrenochaeta sp. MPI-SDFR-AT-0127]|nr:copper amine oxidase [Pyrenochaeta sp. MPI-SDFR-AT-0127]
MASIHPFDPVTPGEIKLASQIIQKALPGVPVRFKRIDLQEPIKKDVIPFLESERLGLRPLPTPPPRIIQALFDNEQSGALNKALVNTRSKSIVYIRELPKHIQAPMDPEELVEMEQLCLNHPKVRAEIEKLELPAEMSVCCEPWMYGTDDIHETRRLIQCYLFVLEVNDPQCNIFSLPCKFSPVFDARSKQLVRIDYLPSGADDKVTPTTPWKPVKTVQYAPNLIDEPLREDLKPYIVQQPLGGSYTVEGNAVSWQKWRFRVGFNSREGLVIYNVTYNGRNVFYRLSLSEMTVPYGDIDPRRPYHRKQAFDAGDVGFGITANQLTLGCDCLGHIKYFDAYRADGKGDPIKMSNVVCLHEQDNGLLHKHTNWRNDVATVVRNRQLVVQMICTLANYEYIFAWTFDQAAGIELEIRATGILSTTPFDNENGEIAPWATNVGPGVSAPYHQHMFSYRIDPAIDGFQNTIFYQESVPLPNGPSNVYGAGYTTVGNTIKNSGSEDLSVERHRVFKIRNDSIKNPITHKAVAYKLHATPSQMLLNGPESFNQKRAVFATKPIWVTKYQDDELFAGGEFTNQSRRSDGVDIWAAREDNVENEDIVLWHTIGLTHNPRIEDFPIMPMERISVALKPDGFFTKNPALDVPPSDQRFNKSTLHADHSVADSRACCTPKDRVVKL